MPTEKLRAIHRRCASVLPRIARTTAVTLDTTRNAPSRRSSGYVYGVGAWREQREGRAEYQRIDHEEPSGDPMDARPAAAQLRSELQETEHRIEKPGPSVREQPHGQVHPVYESGGNRTRHRRQGSLIEAHRKDHECHEDVAEERTGRKQTVRYYGLRDDRSLGKTGSHAGDPTHLSVSPAGASRRHCGPGVDTCP